MYDDIIAAIAERTKTAREALGLSQSELAEKAGVDYNSVRYLENGKTRSPRLETVYLIAEALGVDIGWMCNGRTAASDMTTHCTYKRIKDRRNGYITGCGVKHLDAIGKNWIYCPICGRKVRKAI